MTFRFFTKGGKDVASSRYRVYYLADELKKMGHKADIFSLGFAWKEKKSLRDNIKLFFKYLKLLQSFNKEDIIILQRTIYNKWFLMAVLVSRLIYGREFIFDIDDVVFEHSFVKTWLLTKLGKAVICGGHSVLDWAKRYNTNSFYLPDGIPLEFYSPFAKNYETKNNPLIIGWVGYGPAHLENLKLLKPVFEDLIRKDLTFKFRLIGALGDRRIYDFFREIAGLDVEIIDTLDWSDPRNIAREIQRFDVGIMPLIENNWNRAKYFKTLEYMACAIPPIVSGFGENKFIIRDGENGFLADMTDEWCEKIKLLLTGQKLRQRLGEKAQLDIKNKFSIQQITRQLIKLTAE